MNYLGLAASLLAGIVCGLFYFGGLWWTVCRIPHLRHPAAFLFASFLLRTLIVLCVFYLVTHGRWERLSAGLVGFLVTRVLLVRRLRSAPLPSGARE